MRLSYFWDAFVGDYSDFGGCFCEVLVFCFYVSGGVYFRWTFLFRLAPHTWSASRSPDLGICQTERGGDRTANASFILCVVCAVS